MDQLHDEESFARVDIEAERYWLRGMDLGYAKRRALVEHERRTSPQEVLKGPVIRV